MSWANVVARLSAFLGFLRASPPLNDGLYKHSTMTHHRQQRMLLSRVLIGSKGAKDTNRVLNSRQNGLPDIRYLLGVG